MKTKWTKLACSAAVIVLMALTLWVLLEMPAFTAESAFRRTESRQLLAESRFLGTSFRSIVHYSSDRGAIRGRSFDHVGVGVTETALHLTELHKLDLRWYNDEEMVVIPREGEVTVEFEPWGAEFQDVAIFVYTELDYDHGTAVLTIGGVPFDARFTADPSGFTDVPFEPLSGVVADGRQEQAILRQYDLRSVGYDKSRKTQHITLEVVLYDGHDTELARVVKEYPVQE